MGRPFGYLIVRLIAVIAIVLSPCSYTYAETMYGDIETEGICCIMPGKASKASCVSKLPSETDRKSVV